MTDAIGEDEYTAEVGRYASYLLGDAKGAVESDDYDAVRDAILDISEEMASHHNWFARDYYGGVLYGSIVEHRLAETERYADWMALIESDDPGRTLKRLAYVVFEADVTHTALQKYENDE